MKNKIIELIESNEEVFAGAFLMRFPTDEELTDAEKALGFEKHITLEEVKRYDLPYADGYRGFWEENISIQHPLATVELVAWDSGCTLFISKDDEMVNKFRREFPLSVDLEMYNKGALDDSDAYEKWLENQNG